VEALASDGRLTSVQEAMVECHGSQCGFCTPGFVMAMTATCHQRATSPEESSPVDWPLELSGNLCRCTGYLPILEAARRCESSDGEISKWSRIPEATRRRFDLLGSSPFDASGTHRGSHRRVLSPVTLEAALRIRADLPEAQLVAGATDLGVQWTKARKAAAVWIDLGRVPELRGVTVCEVEPDRSGDEPVDGGAARAIEAGAMATWAELLERSRTDLPEFASILERFGGPQIRNSGTIGGNIMNASSIADSLPLLSVMDASLELASPEGRRRVDVNRFFSANRRTVIQADELLVSVRIPLPSPHQRLRLHKVSRRHDLDIATVSAAICLTVDDGRITQAAIALGGVGPTVRRLEGVERWLIDRPCLEATFEAAGRLAADEISPWSDVRGTAEYRRQIVGGLLTRHFHEMSSDMGAGE
ncbi:MAG: hypothetical protein GY704_03520, partial [Phycisphaeraceae bacterium]|nr:hypothetical protein [Phycisphaeraceae bacterium]